MADPSSFKVGNSDEEPSPAEIMCFLFKLAVHIKTTTGCIKSFIGLNLRCLTCFTLTSANPNFKGALNVIKLHLNSRFCPKQLVLLEFVF